MTAPTDPGKSLFKGLSAEPLPADLNGQRLCTIFGRYLWHCIQAQRPDDATAKVGWRTVTRYPLRPRALWALWQDANTLLGVRFAHETTYALLDIDAGSAYCNPNDVARLRFALETIGITRTILLRSSYSGGLHLYVPLPETVSTFSLAVTLQECCRSQGFSLQQGQLEIFPNVKAYGVQTFVEYKAHRLPLQPGSGSCLLNDDLNPLGESLERFFWRWDQSAGHQDMEMLRQALQLGRDNHRRRPKRRHHPVDAWRQDLETEMGEGWTDYGQTNHLLKTIACHGRVFKQLEEQDLIDYVVQVATACPGYEQYCRHQFEIRARAQAWARAAENYYWPLGTTPRRVLEPSQNNLVGFNRRQAESARQRIGSAYASLKQAGTLPEQITARAKALAQTAGVSQQTLYKNLNLWHPEHQGVIDEKPGISAPETGPEEPPKEPPNPLKIKGLHPSGKIMKGWGSAEVDGGSDPELFTPQRGVRGETGDFPQVADARGAIPFDELLQELQRQVQRLRLTAKQLGQFIAERFGGRRRSELSNDDLVLLLYYLRDSCLVGEASGGEIGLPEMGTEGSG